MKDFEVHNGIRYKLEESKNPYTENKQIATLNLYYNIRDINLNISELKDLKYVIDKLLEEHEKVCKNG